MEFREAREGKPAEKNSPREITRIRKISLDVQMRVGADPM